MMIFGNKDQFALEFSFEADPDKGKKALPEYAASWGHMALWIEGKNLCQYMHQGEVQQYIAWYFLPFLEWLTQNWGSLLFEEAPPSSADKGNNARQLFFEYGKARYGIMPEEHENTWYAWGQRHALRACAEGGIFPDLFIRSRGEHVEFSWGNAPIPGMPVGLYFTVPYAATSVTREAVVQPLHDFLAWAVPNLKGKMPDSPRLEMLMCAVAELKSTLEANIHWIIPAVRDNQISFAEIKNKIQSIMSDLDFSRGLPAPVLMFGSCSPNINWADIDTILGGIQQGQESQHCLDYVDSQPIRLDVYPFEQGYNAAQDFLDARDYNLADGFVNIEAILTDLGVRVLRMAFGDTGIRGIAMAGNGLIPTIFLNEKHRLNTNEQGQRFTLAHELCHILHDREYGQELGLVSGPWAPLSVEKRANAFAAMLLMPVDMLNEGCSKVATGNAYELTEMAARFHVNPSALVEHLHNMGSIDGQTRDDLRYACEGECQR